jgi:hypothetical protein
VKFFYSEHLNRKLVGLLTVKNSPQSGLKNHLKSGLKRMDFKLLEHLKTGAVLNGKSSLTIY